VRFSAAALGRLFSAAQIVGIDIVDSRQHNSPRIKTLIADQAKQRL
jgi:hypothetical protein